MRLALLILACASATANELDLSPNAVARRVLARVAESTRAIPRYACVETVTRDVFAAAAPQIRSCDVIMNAADHRPLDLELRRVWTDRLRLDVGMSERGEMHSWAGDTRFQEGRIDELVPEGAIGSGAFGGFLSVIFGQDVKAFRMIAQVTGGARHRTRFAFSVPVENSHYKSKVADDWAPVPYTGTFEADTETGELLWLEIRTGVLPEATGTCHTVTRLDLGRRRLGDRDVLLATSARQRFLARNGGEVVNTMRISDCREYRGESNIRFETTPDARIPGANAPLPNLDLPYGAALTLELTAPIDSATAAAGDFFYARLADAVKPAPRGARVEGRILRVQTYYGRNPEVVIVLRPQSIEVKGVKYPLTATQNTTFLAKEQRPVTGPKKGALILLPLATEKNAGLYRFPGDHAIVKRGFVTHWRTR